MGKFPGIPRNADHIGNDKQVLHRKPELRALRHSVLLPLVQCNHMYVLDLDWLHLQIFRWGRELNWQLVLARKVLKKAGQGVK